MYTCQILIINKICTTTQCSDCLAFK